MKAALAGVGLGAVVAVAAHAVTWPAADPVSAPAPTVTRTVEQWVHLDCPAPTDASESHRELADVKARITELEARLEDAIGVPAAFPDDLDARFHPDNAEATVLQLLDDAGEGELQYVDCSEFPCMAALTFPSASTGFKDTMAGPVPTLLEERFGTTGAWMSGYRPGMDAFTYVQLGDPGDAPGDDASIKRLNYRSRVARDIQTAIRHEEDGL